MSAEQLVAQPVVAEQLKPLQPVVVPAVQFPLPSQMLPAVNPALPQLAARQTVLLPNFSHAPLPSQWPVFPHETGVPAVHPPAGSASPDETAAQVPSGDEPVSALVQAWQVPLQALVQQTPSAQKPLVHWSVAVQACPFGRFPAQTPLWHSPLRQSASAAQVDALHVVADAQATPPGQPLGAGVEQAPAPLQVPTGVSWPPLQEALPQATVEIAFRQPPLPSQNPSWPQVVVPTAQAPFDDPPAATGLQAPVAQVMQVPVQAVAQQTPEMQLPLVHWSLAEQVDPSEKVAAQVFPAVQYPPGQSVSAAHFVAQPVVAVQVKPLQSVVVPGVQLPLPSQVLDEVNPPPPQLAARQTVLLPNFSHAPLPSQWPVFPHEAAVPVAHPPAGSASPDETTAQVPSGDDPVSALVQA